MKYKKAMVYCHDAAGSERAQKALFQLGHRWEYHGRKVIVAPFDKPVIFFELAPGVLTYDSEEYAGRLQREINNDRYVVTVEQLEADASARSADERSPLGLRPESVVTALRAREIADAISRYVYADKRLPYSWLCELQNLVGEK